MTRRQALLGLAGLGLGGTWYARSYAAHDLEITHRTVKLTRLQSGVSIRLLHISDLHSSRVVSLEYLERAFALCASLKPDLICLTGDYITTEILSPQAYCDLFRKLSALAPCFASLGNHDGGVWVESRGGYRDTVAIETLLHEGGIQCLCNASQFLEVQSQRLAIIGLADWWAGDFDPAKAFSQTQADCARIVLSHNPDTKDLLLEYDWDLMLSGHTHGGQIEIPFLGAPLSPVRDKRFIKGLHEWQGRHIHVTKGIGSVFGVRVNCPPEISLLTLVG